MRPQASSEPADLAVIVVSTNEANWLEPCLRTVFEHAGPITLDVIVVDNASCDGTRELVESRFPQARVVASENRGFSHANNRAAMATDARHVLLLNPDTEIVEGTLAGLLAELERRPRVGFVGVRQLTSDGTLWPTIRYFPSPTRALCEALGSERWPVRRRWMGERELDTARYDQEVDCDWSTGAFMLVRREALLGAGLLDERFFMYSDEPDLCLRLKRAGWQVRHLPCLTIIHHANKGGVRPRMVAQDAYTRLLYARKHFGPARRGAYVGAVALRHAMRAALARGPDAPARRAASARALRTLAGTVDPPFGAPPHASVAPARSGPRPAPSPAGVAPTARAAGAERARS
jgi:GT2 family glycosyltransferase